MLLAELLAKQTWDEVEPSMLLLYPDMTLPDLLGYAAVYADLVVMTPVPSTMQIAISPGDDFNDEAYEDVHGVGPDGETYGLDVTPWAQWLGMAIHPQALASYRERDILAHVLWGNDLLRMERTGTRSDTTDF